MILSTTPPPKPLSAYSEKVREAAATLLTAQSALVHADRSTLIAQLAWERDAAFQSLVAALAEERSGSGEPVAWGLLDGRGNLVNYEGDFADYEVFKHRETAQNRADYANKHWPKHHHPVSVVPFYRSAVLPPVALPVTAPEVTEALWDLELIANSLLQQGRRVHPRAIRQHIETIRAAITLSPRAAAEKDNE